jgi:hypothetical protein
MIKDWQELTNMIGDEDIIIQKVFIPHKEITIEGSFNLPPLSKLTMEDQVFVAAFIKCHGSIKQMENLFGISYPTVKNRLNRISEKFQFLEIKPDVNKQEILDKLERGELSPAEAIERMKR